MANKTDAHIVKTNTVNTYEGFSASTKTLMFDLCKAVITHALILFIFSFQQHPNNECFFKVFFNLLGSGDNSWILLQFSVVLLKTFFLLNGKDFSYSC